MHSDLHESMDVYRYMTIEGAVASFKTATFRMKPPRAWDDPYETWWCDQLFRAGSTLARAKAYGLCWTTRNRDEPFWRLYTCPHSPTVPAVRIRTTVSKLLARMRGMIREHHGKAFLGHVRYAPVNALYEKAANLSNEAKQVALHAAVGLHWKRSQFVLEREVRLLWIVTADEELPLHSLSFDCGSLIDQVMIGPTTDPQQALRAAQKLVEAGVPKDLVCDSTLYKKPKATVGQPGRGPTNRSLRPGS